MKIKKLYILTFLVGFIFSGCSKPPERLSIKNNDQLITLEWTDITIEPVPVYWTGFKSGLLTPLNKLDEKTELRVSEELAKTDPPVDRYEPQIAKNLTTRQLKIYLRYFKYQTRQQKTRSPRKSNGAYRSHTLIKHHKNLSRHRNYSIIMQKSHKIYPLCR